jgi:hypothetical protein
MISKGSFCQVAYIIYQYLEAKEVLPQISDRTGSMIFDYCQERFCSSHWRVGSCISMLFFPVIFATFVMHITKLWTEISCYQSTLTFNFQTIEKLLFSIRIQIFFFFFVTSTHIVFFLFLQTQREKKRRQS